MLNRESDDETLNSLIKFVVLMYERSEDYFYLTDVKVLLDVLIRELEHYRSGTPSPVLLRTQPLFDPDCLTVTRYQEQLGETGGLPL